MFAQTERLNLRALRRDELPRLVALIGEWDVVRWISVVPFPYTMQHAEEFYADIESAYAAGQPEFFAMSLKTDGLLIGGVGLHTPRNALYTPGEIEIGYWLGKQFWGRGLMTEAAAAVRDMAFARPATRALSASTSPANEASQKILRKIGLREQGIAPRDYATLRGENEVMKWLLTREQYQAGMPA